MTATLRNAGSHRADSSRRLLLAGLLALAGLTAVAQGGAAKADDDRNGPSVTRITRGGAAAGNTSVGVMRGSRVEPAKESSAPESTQPPALGLSGSIAPDSADGVEDFEEIIDPDPIKAGLPDATAGEPPTRAAPNETFSFPDIGVRGERNGRMIKLVGAQLAFANCEVLVSEGTPLGYTGVMGRVGPNAGSAPALRFTLDSGGTVILTVQPLPGGNAATPNRPVRTVTMTVP